MRRSERVIGDNSEKDERARTEKELSKSMRHSNLGVWLFAVGILLLAISVFTVGILRLCLGILSFVLLVVGFQIVKLHNYVVGFLIGYDTRYRETQKNLPYAPNFRDWKEYNKSTKLPSIDE